MASRNEDRYQESADALSCLAAVMDAALQHLRPPDEVVEAELPTRSELRAALDGVRRVTVRFGRFSGEGE